MNPITHETRRASYGIIRSDAARRRDVILDILKKHGDMTAQEIANMLFLHGLTPSDERNFAAPRLTELKLLGQVETVSRKTCAKTGRSVAVWRIKDNGGK